MSLLCYESVVLVSVLGRVGYMLGEGVDVAWASVRRGELQSLTFRR